MANDEAGPVGLSHLREPRVQAPVTLFYRQRGLYPVDRVDSSIMRSGAEPSSTQDLSLPS